MVKNRMLKTVFTLKSGKSIVVSMYEEQCFKIYNQWVTFNPKSEDIDLCRAVMDKKKDNLIIETVGILLSEIAAIQIVENYNSKNVE